MKSVPTLTVSFGPMSQRRRPSTDHLARADSAVSAPGRSRTCDLSLRRRLLYPLSYWGGAPREAGGRRPSCHAAARTARRILVLPAGPGHHLIDRRNLARTSAHSSAAAATSYSSYPPHVKVTMPDAAQHPAQPELPSAYQRGKRRGRTRRTHTVAKVLLATLLTLGMVSGLSVAFLYRHLNGNLNVVDVADQLERPAGEGEGRGAQGAAQHPGDGLGLPRLRRLRHRPGGRRQARTPRSCSTSRPTGSRRTASRIPRDSLVDRPDCNERGRRHHPAAATSVMWNAAFSIGGPACTIQQFEQTHRRPRRQLRRRRLRQLPGHGRRHRRRRGLRPRGHRQTRSTASPSRPAPGP